MIKRMLKFKKETKNKYVYEEVTDADTPVDPNEAAVAGLYIAKHALPNKPKAIVLSIEDSEL